MAMSYRSITELEVLRSMLEIYNLPALIDRQAARALLDGRWWRIVECTTAERAIMESQGITQID